MAGAVRPAVQVAVLGVAGRAGPARRAGRGLDARRDGREDRVEVRDDVVLPPIIRQKPRSRPKTPPLVPTST